MVIIRIFATEHRLSMLCALYCPHQLHNAS